MTVEEFIKWHDDHPMPGGFPRLPTATLEEMVAENYKLEIREVKAGVFAPYILSPMEAAGLNE